MRHAEMIKDFDPGPGISVATLEYEYAAGHHVTEHAHGSDQLIYATRGVMEVSSGQNIWWIPPHFALWISAGTYHRIRMPSAVSMRTLYIHPGLVSGFSSGCAVLHVSPLLRELILETVHLGKLRTRSRSERALRDLTFLHLTRATRAPMRITIPTDQRALSVARSVLDDPGESMPMKVLCARAGVSTRTIQRLFQKEVGSDFETWRRQVRLIKAVELLISGFSVKEVAFAVGYSQPSPFVEAFRSTYGMTPRVWGLSHRGIAQRA